jgi:hypothetical protein
MSDADMFDDFDLDPDEREQAAENFWLNAQLDAEQAAPDRLADQDPMGFAFSGQAHDGRTAEQADEWLESRLHGKTAK